MSPALEIGKCRKIVSAVLTEMVFDLICHSLRFTIRNVAGLSMSAIGRDEKDSKLSRSTLR
jgi:hypothetical protein